MTDPWAAQLHGPDPDEVFGDLVDVARSVFDLHYGGAEVEWAAWAWWLLGSARLTAAETELDRAVTVVRLAALNAFYREFCARAFSEGEPGEWSVDPERVVGDYPRVHPVLLGVLAERRGLDLDDDMGLEFEHGVTAAAVDGLVRTEYRTVTSTLRQGAGGAAGLFASLWVSRGEDVAYPLAADAVAEVLDAERSTTTDRVRQWLDRGAPLG